MTYQSQHAPQVQRSGSRALGVAAATMAYGSGFGGDEEDALGNATKLMMSANVILANVPKV